MTQIVRKITVAALVASCLTPTTFVSPTLAQPAPQRASQICKTYSFLSPSDDLATSFSTITAVYGDVEYTNGPMQPPFNFLIPNWPPASLWRIAANTGNSWPSFHTTPTAQQGMQIVDIMHGNTARVYPGVTPIPAGVQRVSVARVQGSAMAETRLFNITICGQPKSTQTCAILTVSQAPGVAGRFAPSAMIPLNFPATAKIVSLKSTNMTVAANRSTPAETRAIITPTGPNQPKTANYPIAMNNRHLRFFMTPSTHATDYPVDTWRGQAGQPRYLTIGATVKPGWFVSPINSWVGPVGAADTPAHGIASGQVELCVQ
jgi:hypothetical protein